VDLFIVFQSFVFAYFLRFNFSLEINYLELLQGIPVAILASALSIILAGAHRGVIRHTSERDLLRIVQAQLLTAIILFAFVFFKRRTEFWTGLIIPTSVVSIHIILNIILLSAFRFLYKVIYYRVKKGDITAKNVLIFGAGYTGCLTHQVLTNDTAQQVKIVAFVDDDPKIAGKVLHGIKVLHSPTIDKQYIIDHDIDEIVIAISNLPAPRMREIVDEVVEFGIKITKVPSVSTWTNNQFESKQIQKLKIEDLLNRPPIQIDNPKVQKEYQDKVIIVSGGAGSIGSEIARQLLLYKPKKVILLDIGESPLYEIQQDLVQGGFEAFETLVADIRDKLRIQNIFSRYKPDIVFHAAAYKHVPLMEANPYEAIKVNVFGTKILADLSILNNVKKFVMISTDKAVNPTNVMGATKRLAEKYVTSLKDNGTTSFVTTRFGNVLGSNGSVIPLFKKQLEKGGPLTVTHKDVTRFFMTIPEACQLVLEAGCMGEDGQILIFDMGKSVKIYDLAIRMIQLSGYSYPDEIDIKEIGLRPGEKLYEELLNDKENTIPTYHKKIMIAKVLQVNDIWLHENITILKDLILKQEDMALVEQLKLLIPEFKSKNSVYQSLDNQRTEL
jgi:FlaA1/EpsC-like NDP-sugar epimerase